MGTNYYWHDALPEACPCCGQGIAEKLHIGKSSMGWCFSLRVYTDGTGPENLSDWIDKFNSGIIRDEYGSVITQSEMLDIILNRKGHNDALINNDKMLAINQAIPGPNKLLRHEIGNGCVAHGHGTYDLLDCDFC